MTSDTESTNVPLRLGLGVILCVILVGAGIGTGTATAQETTINVTAAGDLLTDGGDHVVLEDPTANITVTAAKPIDLVEIRVNGEIRHSYRPDSRSFEQAVSLDLDPNENTVEVIARAEGVNTFTTTLTKNTAAPRVRYTSPFSTTVLGGPENQTNVSSGQVTLAGDLHTVAEVDQIQIERTHISEGDDGNNQTRELYHITDPGDSFSQDLLLGTGRNEIVARYTDTNGRTNEDSFELIVDDATDPVINFTAPAESYTGSVRIRGTVRDETKLSRVAVNRTSNNASQVLLTSSNTEPNPDRLSYTIDTTLDLYTDNENNEFRLVAEDAAGNTREQTFTVRYDPTPEVTITENTTNTTAQTVRLAGNVSNARVSRVTLETIDTRSGERLDITRVYDAGPTITAVAFNQTLRAVPGETVVNVLVTYEGRQYTRSVIPVVSASQDTDAEVSTANGSTTDEVNTTNQSQSGTGTTTVENSSESGTASDDETDDPTDNMTESSPTLIPIRTREAFAGVVMVGAIYLLGHWV